MPSQKAIETRARLRPVSTRRSVGSCVGIHVLAYNQPIPTAAPRAARPVITNGPKRHLQPACIGPQYGAVILGRSGDIRERQAMPTRAIPGVLLGGGSRGGREPKHPATGFEMLDLN